MLKTKTMKNLKSLTFESYEAQQRNQVKTIHGSYTIIYELGEVRMGILRRSCLQDVLVTIPSIVLEVTI